MSERGFTLLEVLVAFVVLAIAGVAVLQLFGGGLRLARTAGDHVGATLLADAKLAELPAAPLDEGATEGTDGIYHWTRRISFERALLPLEPTAPEAATVRLARISVEVRWGANRRLEMVTLRTWSSAS